VECFAHCCHFQECIKSRPYVKKAHINTNRNRRTYNASKHLDGPSFQDQPIETVTDFQYLGRVITSRDNDWMAARWNLQKAKQRWMNISRVLAHESASPRISALFYKATIQTVLLYGSETWVITDEILQLLTSFHHSIARHITGRYPRLIADTDEWTHPSIQETLCIAGMFSINEYIHQRCAYLECHAQDLPLLQDCRSSLLTE
jgi:hypothetical protein